MSRVQPPRCHGDGQGVALAVAATAAAKLPLEVAQPGVRRPAVLQQLGGDVGPASARAHRSRRPHARRADRRAGWHSAAGCSCFVPLQQSYARAGRRARAVCAGCDSAVTGGSMTGFHEVRFPDNIAYGATGGPEFATTVVATGSRAREAQRQLGRGARPLGCRERAQEAGADRRADRVLPGPQGQGLRLPVQDPMGGWTAADSLTEWGCSSDRPLWRRPWKRSPTAPPNRPPSAPILAQSSSRWNSAVPAGSSPRSYRAARGCHATPFPAATSPACWIGSRNSGGRRRRARDAISRSS